MYPNIAHVSTESLMYGVQYESEIEIECQCAV